MISTAMMYPSAASWSMSGVHATPSHGEQGDISVGADHSEQGDITIPAPPPPDHGEQGDLAAGRIGAAGMRMAQVALSAGATAGRADNASASASMAAVAARGMMLQRGAGALLGLQGARASPLLM